MDGNMYSEILATFLAPYMASHFNIKGGILHQDNDPKHTSSVCVKTLSDIGIKWIKSPAKSPDLNPIEMLWHSMLEYIRKKFCKTVKEVRLAVLEFTETITPQVCQNYINKLHEIIPIIIKNKGGWSNY